MNYAIWQLNFTDPNYGTGPEDELAELGVMAEGAWVSGEPENGGEILGYLSADVDEALLTPWSLVKLTAEEALDFCLNVNSEAFFLENGKIVVPEKGYAF